MKSFCGVPLVAHANRLRRAPKCNCAQVCQQTFTVSSLSVMATNRVLRSRSSGASTFDCGADRHRGLCCMPRNRCQQLQQYQQRHSQQSDVSVTSSSSNNNNKATPTKVKREANSVPLTTTTTTMATRDNNNIHTLLTTTAVKRVS